MPIEQRFLDRTYILFLHMSVTLAQNIPHRGSEAFSIDVKAESDPSPAQTAGEPKVYEIHLGKSFFSIIGILGGICLLCCCYGIVYCIYKYQIRKLEREAVESTDSEVYMQRQA